ncbi:MAG: hypothetical protein LBB50_00885 [Oscillospiraceae bacterium]|jgi:hypothetical protein|nr:hypothetical protein [Oscillospiraceae bacterium]
MSMASQSRRRILLGAQSVVPPPPADVLEWDFRTGLTVDNLQGLSFLSNTSRDPTATYTTINGQRAVRPYTNTYFRVDQPSYGAESLRVDGWIPSNATIWQGPILSCGSDADDPTIGALQYVYQVVQQVCGLKYFDSANTTDVHSLFTEADPGGANNAIHVMFDITRRGAAMNAFASASVGGFGYSFEYGARGTDPTAFNSAMSGLGFGTGLVIPVSSMLIHYLKWERLK